MKKLPTKIILSTLTLSAACSCFATTPTQAIETNVENFDSTLIITGINPSKNELSFIYNKLEQKPYLSFLNIFYSNFDNPNWPEEKIDEELPYIQQSNPVWVKRYYGHFLPPNVTSGVERKFTAEEVAADTTSKHYYLKDNPSGKLYFVAQMKANPNDYEYTADYYYGKIDYTACLNTSVYHDGVECRAEIYPKTNKLIYYPYFNGERMDAPDYKYPESPEPKPTPEPTPTPPQPVPDQPITPTIKPTNSQESSLVNDVPTSGVVLANQLSDSTQSDSDLLAQTTSNSSEFSSVFAPASAKAQSTDVDNDNIQEQPSVNPWPIVIIILASLGLLTFLFWFFIWKRRRNNQDED